AMRLPIPTEAVVAQPAPAMPQPNRNMNNSFNSALSTAVMTAMTSVTRVRPMPLKKPVNTQYTTASGPPSMRGSQYSTASVSISGARPKGPSIADPENASS